MCRKRRACSSTAATTLGWEGPVVTTAMPAVKSRNRLPSTSGNQHPSPLSMTNGYERVKLGDIARAARAITVAALGPGVGVWRERCRELRAIKGRVEMILEGADENTYKLSRL